MKIKQWMAQYKDVLPYIIFGVLTTGINVFVYWLCAYLFHLSVMVSTVIAWIVAVSFAYVTNRRWVFHSAATIPAEIVKEAIYFFVCRIGTGLLDWIGMFILVNQLHFNDLIIKVIANITVIVINYMASKMIIFKSKKQEEL